MSVSPQELRAAYERGENLMALLRSRGGTAENNERMIELSYDLQAGSYVDILANNEEVRVKKVEYAAHIAAVIRETGPCHSLLEAGVGEATTFKYVLDQMSPRPAIAHGFDLCWSRIAVARRFLAEGWPGTQVTLTAARLSGVPYRDSSFDVVFTSHAIEPNRGKESEILKELYRVASRYLVLNEPAYELSSEETRARMDEHSYARDIPGHAERLGMKVIAHRLLIPSRVSRNPTALTLIEKNASAPAAIPAVACPEYHTPLKQLGGSYYSPESMRAYPIIAGIPILRSEHAVVASRLEEFGGPAS
jgi:uncharacterized protein YbaR (Trm112 family)